MAFSWFKKKKNDQPPADEDLAQKMAEWSQQKNAQPLGPDFHAIDSQEKAVAAYRRGELSRVYLFPLVFGGEESDLNCVYVPQFAGIFKERFDELIVALFQQGAVTSYSAQPEYKGRSFVPSALLLEAKGKGGITERIEIW